MDAISVPLLEGNDAIGSSEANSGDADDTRVTCGSSLREGIAPLWLLSVDEEEDVGVDEEDEEAL